MTAFAQHFTYEFRTGVRSATLMFMNYLFPLGLYLMLGFIMPELNEPFREAIIPAMITVSVLAATLLGIPDQLVNAREKGIFRSFKINGVPAISIVSIPALATVLHLCLVSILITISAPVLFDATSPTNLLGLALVFAATGCACAGLGVLIGVVAPDTRATVLLSQAFFLPSMLIGGVMVPYNALPDGPRMVSRLLPATHAMNAFNGLAMDVGADFSPWGSVLVLVTGGILAFALALFLFSWDRHNTTRRAHPLLALLALAPYIVSLILS
jgi:ABC-2 type transport system permease protein